MVLYIIKYTYFVKHFYWYIFTIFNNTFLPIKCKLLKCYSYLLCCIPCAMLFYSELSIYYTRQEGWNLNKAAYGKWYCYLWWKPVANLRDSIVLFIIFSNDVYYDVDDVAVVTKQPTFELISHDSCVSAQVHSYKIKILSSSNELECICIAYVVLIYNLYKHKSNVMVPPANKDRERLYRRHVTNYFVGRTLVGRTFVGR